MSAQPIIRQCVERPKFDDTNIHSLALWVEDNANTLARYWRDLGAALGLSEDDDREFDYWLRVSWDIQRTLSQRAVA